LSSGDRGSITTDGTDNLARVVLVECATQRGQRILAITASARYWPDPPGRRRQHWSGFRSRETAYAGPVLGGARVQDRCAGSRAASPAATGCRSACVVGAGRRVSAHPCV